MTVKKFLKECNEKEVIKKISIYIVTAWLLIQVLTSIWEAIGLPQKSVTILIIVLLIGFPINIYLVWKFHLASLEELKPKLDSKGNPKPGKFKKSPFRKMYFSSLTSITVITVILVVLIINNNFFDTINLRRIESSDKIAILKFDNNTMDDNYEIVGKMTVDWISHGITENKVAQVVSPEIIENYETLLKASIIPDKNVTVLDDYLKPAKIIHGNYYLKQDKFVFQCSIEDGDLNETIISFKSVECDSKDPMDCIESLKQLILGYLITSENTALNLQETPPKFRAYKAVTEAKEVSNDVTVPDSLKSDKYIKLIDDAIEFDSTYFYPKVLRVGHYYNVGMYKKADSLLKIIKPTLETQRRQQNLLSFYDAVLKGINKKAVECIKYEYDFAPFDIETNTSLMVLNNQFINRPQDNDSIYKVIPISNVNLESCEWCRYRVHMKAVSDIELGKYDETIDFLKNYVNSIEDDLFIKESLISAYSRSGNIDGVESILSDTLTTSKKELLACYLSAGKEFLLLNDKERAVAFFQRINSSWKQGKANKQYASSFYYSEDFMTAEKALEEALESNPDNKEILTQLAVTYSKNGKQDIAKRSIAHLESMIDDYQYGEIDYRLAQYYAALGDSTSTYRHLLKAVSQGFKYKNNTYQNDPHFLAYKNSETFEKIMTFWH